MIALMEHVDRSSGREGGKEGMEDSPICELPKICTSFLIVAVKLQVTQEHSWQELFDFTEAHVHVERLDNDIHKEILSPRGVSIDTECLGKSV